MIRLAFSNSDHQYRRRMVHHRLLLLLALGCFLPLRLLCNQTSAPASALPVIPTGANLKDPQTLLTLGSSANSLDASSATPWHLTASFESFDGHGKPAAKGTFEEWRLSPGTWKRIYTSDTYRQTEYGSTDGLTYESDSGAPPWPLSLISSELSHPIPNPLEASGTTPEMRPLTQGAVNLNCLIFATPLKQQRWPLGVMPTYCFKPDTVMLRMEIINGGVEATRNEIAAFHGSYFAREINLSDDGKPLLRIHLLSLSSMASEEVARITLPAVSSSSPQVKEVTVKDGIMASRRVSGPAPDVPVAAFRRGIRGTVVLRAIIGPDGHIQQLQVESSPDDLLSISAVAAVERWVYKPLTLHGAPVSIKTQIKVLFGAAP
jgi:TonB family protein